MSLNVPMSLVLVRLACNEGGDEAVCRSRVARSSVELQNARERSIRNWKTGSLRVLQDEPLLDL